MKTQSDDDKHMLAGSVPDPMSYDEEQLEARFYEQEHRLWQLFRNFSERHRFAKGDARRKAVESALFWKLVFLFVFVGGGATLAISSFIIVVLQTGLIAEQNFLFREQNSAIQSQIQQQADQELLRRRTEVIAAIYGVAPGETTANVPYINPRTRIEAFREFVPLERTRLSRGAERSSWQSVFASRTSGQIETSYPAVSLSQVDATNLNLSGQDFENVNFVGSTLDNTDFSNANLLLADLRASIFLNTNFAFADLRGVECEACNLKGAQFGRADLRDINLASASAEDANFFCADLRGANLYRLRDIETAEWHGANISGVSGLEAAQRIQLEEAGAVLADDIAGWQWTCAEIEKEF
ncbi:MAG: pentapeptide repeat-containing protein [Pseudomonadota bacterium]